MSVILLAQQGKIGNNTYYITTMKANTLITTVGYACEMENWPDMSVDERMQRELKGDRVASEIVPYISSDPDWFFGALIIDIYTGWENVKFQNIREVCSAPFDAYDVAMDNTGFLTLPDDKSLIALDGQHRLAALSMAIRGQNGIPGSVKVSESLRRELVPHKEIGEADITVIFIKHTSDYVIRKIFNRVNRYAKQTSKGDNIITSEDDMIAVITRGMFSGRENAPLKPVKGQDLVNWKSNTIPLRSKMLTTAAAIYTMTEVMLERYNITPKTPRKDEKVNQGMDFMDDFWNKTMEEVDIFKEYKQYILDGNPMEKLRAKNLLLKPVTQMALAQAVKISMDLGYTYEQLIPKINKVNWDPDYYIWANILVTTGSKKKMLTGSQALKDAGSLIAYMLCGEKFKQAEKDRLLVLIREANDDEALDLPPIV